LEFCTETSFMERYLVLLGSDVSSKMMPISFVGQTRYKHKSWEFSIYLTIFTQYLDSSMSLSCLQDPKSIWEILSIGT
jgi:hypothetical protein